MSSCHVIEWCVFVLPCTQQTVAVWLLPSLVMVRIWTGGGVRDLQTGSCHSHCTDRLCLITEGEKQVPQCIPAVEIVLHVHLFHVTMEMHCIQLKIFPDTQQRA